MENSKRNKLLKIPVQRLQLVDNLGDLDCDTCEGHGCVYTGTENFQTYLDRHVQAVVEQATKQIDVKIVALVITELLKRMPKGSFEMVKFEDGAVKAEFKRLKDQKWSKTETMSAKDDFDTELQQIILNILN